MSAELSRHFPDQSETLQIAARGQHIERWTLKKRKKVTRKASPLQ